MSYWDKFRGREGVHTDEQGNLRVPEFAMTQQERQQTYDRTGRKFLDLKEEYKTASPEQQPEFLQLAQSLQGGMSANISGSSAATNLNARFDAQEIIKQC